MTKEQWERLVAMLLETIEGKDFDLLIKTENNKQLKIEVENLKAEVARLEELLTPTNKIDEEQK